jgi:N6-L-threonylcarbamoyladenine synthase
MFIGIDTSNYTTSIAGIDVNGNIQIDNRKVLPVKKGQRGLRQSEAVFEHVRNIPNLTSCFDQFSDVKNCIDAIGVSVSPRPRKESYMPVFRVGYAVAKSFADVLQVPLYAFSHQEGHIRAALIGNEKLSNRLKTPYLAVHLSGGTSEIIKIDPCNHTSEIVGSTLDLNAGQLIDRIGVSIGYGFPAGKELEKLAKTAKDFDIKIPSRLEGGNFHFSGQENYIHQLIDDGNKPCEIAYALFECIGRTIGRAINFICENHHIETVVFSGGVMANSIVKDTIQKRLKRQYCPIFAQAKFATDNGVGCAFLAKQSYEQLKAGMR